MAKIKSCESIDEKKLSELPIVGNAPSNEKEEKYLREFATFEFYNLEEPGLHHECSYGSTKNQVFFSFQHGQKYKLPRHVARHMETRTTPIYQWRPNGHGGMQKTLTGHKSRFQMRSVFA